MNIKYNQLCIRNAEKKDCEQLAVWWNDGTVMAHAGFPNGLGTSAAEIEKQIADDSDETRRRLIIEYNDVRIGEMKSESKSANPITRKKALEELY